MTSSYPIDISASWLASPDLSETKDAISQIRQARIQEAFQLLERSPELSRFLRLGLRTQHSVFHQAVVEIGQDHELNEEQRLVLRAALEAQVPWKKGPFSIFGIEIDAEWRSDWKWERIYRQRPVLSGKTIADIGCHNGYFMFRMLADHPRLVIGFEPVAKHWMSFHMLNSLVQQEALQFELLGVEHIDLFPKFFDTIFCLGILYHHTDPISLLRKMKTALKPGGELWIDCQGIPGDEPVALIPRNRYANAKGIWFLPTLPALTHWVRRAGFQKVECFFAEALSPLEQRSTSWAPVKSLIDFLDPNDKTKTIEGYPAPWRYYLRIS